MIAAHPKGSPAIGDEQRTAFRRQVLEPFPLDTEPVLVHRVVEPAAQRAQVLAAAPVIDIGTPRRILGLGSDHLGPRHLHELAAARAQDPVGARGAAGVRLQPVPRGEIDDDVLRIGCGLALGLGRLRHGFR
jgi:hypothetical protein